jgi:hypothetical protein
VPTLETLKANKEAKCLTDEDEARCIIEEWEREYEEEIVPMMQRIAANPYTYKVYEQQYVYHRLNEIKYDPRFFCFYELQQRKEALKSWEHVLSLGPERHVHERRNGTLDEFMAEAHM